MSRQFSHNRRAFLSATSAAILAGNLRSQGQEQGAKSLGTQVGKVTVELPRGRVPVSFVIDDSTCLVNMGHFCTPQFAEAWPGRDEYKKPWKTWPREIPDAFVDEFGTWCAEHNVKGKYSIVPNPACVGWLDRELPGWSRRELQQSLKLVRDRMLPNWDIHPEMITHTRVIDLKTGRPIEEISAATMENSFPQTKKSVDELAEYLAYALKILKHCELPCEGITTPGGFGNAVKPELPLAVAQAVRDVFPAVEIPHYFKYVRSGDESTDPVAEQVRGQGTSDLSFTMNVPAGTGDWFGGWQGDVASEPDRYLTADGQNGRMAELIARRDPAVMLCHWPGMYCNGNKSGFKAFQRIVLDLAEHYGDRILWMKMSELARYYAAKEFTRIESVGDDIMLQAPYAAPDFTLQVAINGAPREIRLRVDGGGEDLLKEVPSQQQLRSGQVYWETQGAESSALCCFDLPQGMSVLEL